MSRAWATRQAVLAAPVARPERVQLPLQGWGGHSLVPGASAPLLRLLLSPGQSTPAVSNCPSVAGQCDFGSNCRFSHMSERDLQELSIQVEGASPGPWAGGQGMLRGGLLPCVSPTPSFVTAMSGGPWLQELPSVHPGHDWGRSQKLPSMSPAGFKVRRMASCPGVLRVCLSPAGALLACPSFLYTHLPFLTQATCLGSLLSPWQLPCCRSGSEGIKRAPSLTSGRSMER